MSIALAITRLLGAGAGWLIERPSRAIAAGLMLALAGHHLAIDPGLRRQRDVARGAVEILAARAVAERGAHQLTKANYRAAQAQAAVLEAERIARVKAQQQEITHGIVAPYRIRLADAHARAEQLRRELARAGKHPSGAAADLGMPGTGAAAGGADGSPAYPRLPADQLERDLIATEQALQLNALIDWVEAQSRVKVNP